MTHDFSRRATRWLPGLAVVLALGVGPGRARADLTLYDAEYNTNTIQTFNSSGAGTTFYSGSGLNHPNGLVFDSSGNLYVANLDSSSIEKITPAGVATTFYSSPTTFSPQALAFNSSGNLYVTNGNTIEKITPAGVASLFSNGVGLLGPDALAFDSSDNLYVGSLLNNTIEKFTPAGVGSLFANTAGSPLALAFGPTVVPEPSSLVLMTLGSLGAIAFMARRRVAGSAGRTARPS